MTTSEWEVAQIKQTSVFIPIVDHELLHSQQCVVTDELVLVVHMIHHKLFSTQLLNNPEMGRKEGKKPLHAQKTGPIFIF